jgi:hypothetical protein
LIKGVDLLESNSDLLVTLRSGNREIATLRVRRASPLPASGYQSRTHDGRVAEIVTCGPYRVAVDVESVEADGIRYLSSRIGVTADHFTRLWTLLECCAKLETEPVHDLLQRFRNSPDASSVAEAYPHISWCTLSASPIILTAAWHSLPAAHRHA